MEKVRSSNLRFRGSLLQLRQDQVEMQDGRLATREVVEHPGAVGILPITPDGKIVLVEQYRHAAGRTMLEIPAGTREPGEALQDTARRELLEETGLSAARIEQLARFYTSPGWSTEEIVLFLAHATGSAGPSLDPDEILNVVEMDLDAFPVLMRDGLIADAKTITALALYLAGLHLATDQP